MPFLAKNANLRFLLNDVEVTPPKNWEEVGVLATFENGEVEANITIDEFEFGLDARKIVKDHIANGNIFIGIRFQIQIFDLTRVETKFDGYLDVKTAIVNDERGFVRLRIQKPESIDGLNDRLAALNWDYLRDLGVISQRDYIDVDYAVVKIDYTVEAVLQAITIATLSIQLAEAIEKISSTVLQVNIDLANPVTSANGAALAAGKIIINTIYALAIVFQILGIARTLIDAFLQPERTHKAMTYRALMEKVLSYLNIDLFTSYEFLDKWVYLPSNTNVDEFNPITGFLQRPKSIEIGTPSPRDFGYNCADFFELVRRMLNGRYKLTQRPGQNALLEFHSELSPYWEVGTTLVLPNVLEENYSYNTEECKASVLLAFQTDLRDGYTIENFKGTNYQVLTRVANPIDERTDVITDSIQENLPIALGNRKDRFTALESILLTLATITDSIVNTITRLFFLGRRSFLARGIREKIGILKVENNNHEIPKVLFLQNGRLPSDHRERLSARILWDNGWKDTSFIQNDRKRQRIIYADVEIPFGFDSFELIANSSRSRTFNGRKVVLKKVEWTAALDTAIATYEVEQPYVPAENLIETEIEPE